MPGSKEAQMGTSRMRNTLLSSLPVFLAVLIAGTFSLAAAGEIPITKDNIQTLQGEWEGTRTGTEGGKSGMGGVSMTVVSTEPFRAKLTFYQVPRGGNYSYGFAGDLKDGAISGEMMGPRRPSLKLTLQQKEGSPPEVRGEYYSSAGAVDFRGTFRLQKK